MTMTTDLTTDQLAKYLDHTNLKPEATEASIRQTCEEAIKYNTASVCINSHWIPLAAELLKDTTVNPITVVGFPLGATNTATKVYEAITAIDDGAVEIDMVLNVGELISGNLEFVTKDIQAVAEACHAKQKLLKVILKPHF